MKSWYCGKEEMIPVPGADYLRCPVCLATWNEVPAVGREKTGDTGMKYARAKNTPSFIRWRERTHG